jgi:hypothetical protein
MVFVRDEGSVLDAPLDVVWEFVGSGDPHSHAHHHRSWRRDRGEGNSGTYSWEQEFSGRATRFTMHWVSYHPLGVAYDVPEGPFAGSRFFLYYTPMGARTGVTVVGEFVSPSIPDALLETEVLRFFAIEFDQDHAAILARVASK